MSLARLPFALMSAAVLVWACSSGEPADDLEDTRDLTLAPAESLTTFADEPQVDPEPQTDPDPVTPQRPRRPPPPPPEPEPEPVPPTVREGTVITLFSTDTVTSERNEVGESVWATIAEPVYDEDGNEVVPAGAVFMGTISDIGGDGLMRLTFDRVEFGGASYAVQGFVDSLGTRTEGGGVSAGDAAKVGAGAVVGAIAGRILGGNKKGTIVGAVAGAAAGAGVAAATKGSHTVLDAGGFIRLVLTEPLVLEPLRTF